MRVLGSALFLALTAAVCDGRPTPAVMNNAGAAAESRESFLARVDKALASRDPQNILTLSDLAAWKESGRPAPAADALTLPPAPIARRPGPSEVDVIYTDGTGREWRLVVRGDERTAWAIVLHDRACPPRIGMGRSPEFERPAAAADSRAVWTPLECWPLPK